MSSSDGGNDDEETANPYLTLRKAKIARNQARLRELGLLSTEPLDSPLPPATKKARTNDEARTPSLDQEREEPVILRRSYRLKTKPNEQPVQESSEIISKPKFLLRQKEASPEHKRPIRKSLPRSTHINPFSVRTISLDVERLVFGDPSLGIPEALGVLMERTGKDHVIQESFRRAASTEDKVRFPAVVPPLSFNKYCGVQEWENALFLWVNLGGNDTTVVNEFLNNCEQITWFGGSRMHEESPVIQRLLAAGRQKTTSSSILLWCRKYQDSTRTFGPYVCLGRLTYHSHVPLSSPVAFCWNLIDSNRLKNHPKERVRNLFADFTA